MEFGKRKRLESNIFGGNTFGGASRPGDWGKGGGLSSFCKMFREVRVDRTGVQSLGVQGPSHRWVGGRLGSIPPL